MLKASGEGRKRVGALFAFIGATLGLTALAGLAQRHLTSTSSLLPEPPPLKRYTPEEIQYRRALIKKIRELSRKQDWKGVVAATATECSSPDGCSPLVRSAYMEASVHLGTPGMAERFVASLRANADSDPVAEADALAFLNKRTEYIQYVEALLAQQDPQKASAKEANNAAWAALLMPGTPPQPEKVLALAERGATQAGPDEKATFLNTLGVTLYRLGRDTEAIYTLTTTEKLLSEPLNWPCLAMAYKREGNVTEAKKWANRYRTFMHSTFGLPERNRVEPLLFLRELNEAIPQEKRSNSIEAEAKAESGSPAHPALHAQGGSSHLPVE